MDLRLQTVRNKVLNFLEYDSGSGGIATTQWPDLIAFAYPGLARLTLVDQIMSLVQRMLFNWTRPQELFDFAEYCAGHGRMTVEMMRTSFKGVALDIAYSQEHDMTTPQGLRLFLDCLTATRQGGMHWWGTKCSSFVSLCSSIAQRLDWNNYFGDTSRRFVSEGNMQAEVTAFGLFLSVICGCLPCLEQPISSVMVQLPSLRHVLEYFHFMPKMVWMGSCGGPSPKPLQIWHTAGLDLSALLRPKPFGLDGGLVAQDADAGSWTGVKDRLVQSEHLRVWCKGSSMF